MTAFIASCVSEPESCASTLIVSCEYLIRLGPLLCRAVRELTLCLETINMFARSLLGVKQPSMKRPTVLVTNDDGPVRPPLHTSQGISSCVAHSQTQLVLPLYVSKASSRHVQYSDMQAGPWTSTSTARRPRLERYCRIAFEPEELVSSLHVRT